MNVGAGAGSYEPPDRYVFAVEPSRVMLGQHLGSCRVRASAEQLPFADRRFDAAMAVMTLHHWRDLPAGLRELRRVSHRQVDFTWDPDHARKVWIVSEYLPEIRTIEQARFPPLEAVVQALQARTVPAFPIPFDFVDGYQPAYWRRPEAYLDPRIRAASSTFAELPESIVEPAMARLREDLKSGAWHERHGDLLVAEQIDYGYRLVVAG